MKKIEGADVIAANGAGLEDFMDDALAASSAAVIDCSQGVALLENADHIHEEGDGGHDHGHWDPPLLDGPGKRRRHGAQSPGGLRPGGPGPRRRLRPAMGRRPPASCPALPATAPRPWGGAEGAALITFHDGFRFAQAWACPSGLHRGGGRAARPAPWRSMRSPSW